MIVLGGVIVALAIALISAPAAASAAVALAAAAGCKQGRGGGRGSRGWRQKPLQGQKELATSVADDIKYAYKNGELLHATLTSTHVTVSRSVFESWVLAAALQLPFALYFHPKPTCLCGPRTSVLKVPKPTDD